MSIRESVVVLASLLGMTGIGVCSEHEYEQHTAHVHGEASLLVALEGNSLEIELLSPAMNLVGFEHMPANDEQERVVDEAAKQLQKASELFVIPAAAGCVVQSAQVSSPMLDHAGREEHEAHQHDEEGKHTDTDEHEGHAEFTAHYRIACSHPASLDEMAIGLFALFPATEQIEAQIITPQGQSLLELSADNSVVKFR